MSTIGQAFGHTVGRAVGDLLDIGAEVVTAGALAVGGRLPAPTRTSRRHLEVLRAHPDGRR